MPCRKQGDNPAPDRPPDHNSFRSGDPVASTSTLPQPGPATQGRQDGDLGGECWCLRKEEGPGPRRRLRTKRARVGRSSPLVLAATTATILASVPNSASASPVKLGKQRLRDDNIQLLEALPSSRSRSSCTQEPTSVPPPLQTTPPPTPTPAPLILQRRADLAYSQDGAGEGNRVFYEPITPWSLNGRSGAGRLVANPTSTSSVDNGVQAMEDNLNASPSQTTQPSASASSSAALTTKIATSSTSAPSTSSLVIPSGWTTKKRETGFYAVPVIIAVSVILAIIVVGAIVGSVVWRRKARNRGVKNKKRDPEKAVKGIPAGGVGKALAKGLRKVRRKGKGKQVETAPAHEENDTARRNTVGGGREVRRRRVSRIRAGDDESVALTRSHSGVSVPPDTLTNRLAARFRLNNSSRLPPVNPSTIFSSPNIDRSRTRDSATSSVLTRTSSIQSHRVVDDNLSTLGQPQDPHRPVSIRTSTLSLSSPTPSSPSSPSPFGGVFATDPSIPAPGPPAYRPSSTTIQSTTRLSHSILPVTSRSDPPQRQIATWPEEKDRNRPSSPRPLTPPPAIPSSSDTTEADEEAERQQYTAHVATDDKALLALLQSSVPSPFASADLPEPTAPDAVIDHEGFETFAEEGTTTPEASTSADPASSFLPLPPRRVSIAFNYASPGRASAMEGEEEEAQREAFSLPQYVPRHDVPEPSAPPPDDDDEDYHGEEEWDGREAVNTVRIEEDAEETSR
ncbi:hypothetical protein P7C70_g7048, partial [Phenoliferia sp. Uapishka_3]